MTDYTLYSPETIQTTIDALPAQVTAKDLAQLLEVSLTTVRRRAAKGRVPAADTAPGALVWDRERLRPWLTDRLAAIEERLQLDSDNISVLVSSYGDCHVSDYYIHGHAPYIHPVVFAPTPEEWPVVAREAS